MTNQIDKLTKRISEKIKEDALLNSDLNTEFGEAVDIIMTSETVKSALLTSLAMMLTSPNVSIPMADITNLLALVYMAGKISVTEDLEEKVK